MFSLHSLCVSFHNFAFRRIIYKTFSPAVVLTRVSSVQRLSSLTDLTSPSTPMVWWWAFLSSVIAFKWADSGPLMHLALHVLPSLHLKSCLVRSLLNEQEVVAATYCWEWTVLLVRHYFYEVGLHFWKDLFSRKWTILLGRHYF